MNKLALYIGKLTFITLQLFGRRGAALPGLVVEKLAPNFMSTYLDRLENGVVVVTGTNGKTTTTKMLSHVLSEKYRVLTNPTGSNFTRGIVASIVQHTTWSGKLAYDIAVLELDEAYAVKFIQQHPPKGVVVLNIMRDQMDRFGEIDATAKMLEKVTISSRDFCVLNRDDNRVRSLSENTSSRVLFFGVAPKLRKLFVNDDELHGKNIVVKNNNKATAELVDTTPTFCDFLVNEKKMRCSLQTSSAHNAQNATAVLAVCSALDFDIEAAVRRLESVKPAFGRGEVFTVSGRTLILQLVKNPGGFRHALLDGMTKPVTQTVIAINDDYPDGRDVSWLWDVTFAGRLRGDLITAGTRADDMALRLKYDDFTPVKIVPDISTELKQLLLQTAEGDTTLIYATYTAMLAIRSKLATLTKVEAV